MSRSLNGYAGEVRIAVVTQSDWSSRLLRCFEVNANTESAPPADRSLLIERLR